jgi:hypothetical protein
MSNLRQSGIASYIYAADHQDRFPWTVAASETIGFTGTILDCYEPLRSLLGHNARVFVCPTDSKRSPTTNALQSTNLSYFINLSSRLGSTNQVLAGDRHLAKNTVAVGPGRIGIVPGSSLDWTRELHPGKGSGGRGAMVFTDAHAEFSKGDSNLGRAFNRSGLAEQTLLIP